MKNLMIILIMDKVTQAAKLLPKALKKDKDLRFYKENNQILQFKNHTKVLSSV